MQKILGKDYYFSWDYAAIATTCKKEAAAKSPTDMGVDEDYPRRIGEILHGEKARGSYLASIVENLELLAKDSMNVEAFKAKTPAKAIVIREGTVTTEDDVYRAHKQSFESGAFVITFNPPKFWCNIEMLLRPDIITPML